MIFYSNSFISPRGIYFLKKITNTSFAYNNSSLIQFNKKKNFFYTSILSNNYKTNLFNLHFTASFKTILLKFDSYFTELKKQSVHFIKIFYFFLKKLPSLNWNIIFNGWSLIFFKLLILIAKQYYIKSIIFKPKTPFNLYLLKKLRSIKKTRKKKLFKSLNFK